MDFGAMLGFWFMKRDTTLVFIIRCTTDMVMDFVVLLKKIVTMTVPTRLR